MNQEIIRFIVGKYRGVPTRIRASFWFLICSFLQNGIAVITTPIFTRLMSTSEYGDYGAFNSWMGIITIIVSLNLSSGVFTQGIVKFDKEREMFISSVQGLNLTLCTMWTVVYLSFYRFWNSLFGLSTVQMLAMLAMIWAHAAFAFWLVEQRILLEYQRLVFVTIVVSIFQPLVGILFVIYLDDKVTGRILGQMLVQLVCYSYFFYIHIQQGKHFFSKKYWAYMLSLNLPLILHYLSQIVLNSADRIMIKELVGSSEAGIYSLASSIANITLLFNVSILQTVTPWMFQKIQDKKIEDIAPIAYTSSILIAIVNVLFIAFAPEAVAIFAPAPYMEAVEVIPPLAMSVYFVFLYTFFANFEFYHEKTMQIITASLFGAGLNIVLNYIYIPSFGYIAAGYTTLICYVIYASSHYFFMRQICQYDMDGTIVYDSKKLVGISMGFLGCGLLLTLTYTNVFLRYIVIIWIIFIGIWKREKITDSVTSIWAVRK